VNRKRIDKAAFTARVGADGQRNRCGDRAADPGAAAFVGFAALPVASTNRRDRQD
jgi:hypothetical protein